MLVTVTAITTARELWVALASMFSSQSLSRVNNIRTALINTQKGNQSVSSFFTAMRGLANEISAEGKLIQDDKLISYIIHGLDQDYQPLVSALDARVTPVTLDELFAMLSNFDQRMAQFHGSGGGFSSSSGGDSSGAAVSTAAPAGDGHSRGLGFR